MDNPYVCTSIPGIILVYPATEILRIQSGGIFLIGAENKLWRSRNKPVITKGYGEHDLCHSGYAKAQCNTFIRKRH
jgi:hypothetical protein